MKDSPVKSYSTQRSVEYYIQQKRRQFQQ